MFIPLDDLTDVPAGTYFRNRGNDLGIRRAEGQVDGRVPRDLETAFMDEAMVVGAEEGDVVEARLTTVRPVPDMVPIEMVFARAAGEAAAAIAPLERSTQRRRDGSGSSPHVQGLAVLVVQVAHDPGVAGEAPGRFS